jgi:hypothetical protein
MEPRKPEGTSYYYDAAWYALDLFMPISVGVTAAAWTRTSTSPACGRGCGASS